MKKRYGQHFLSDPNILRRIVEFSGIQPTDIVVEIGPGAGALTRALAAAANRVIAIEIDRDLIPSLRRTAAANVEIVEGDALEVSFENFGERFHVAGNLPFNVATPLLKRFIEQRARIAAVTVMIQKEVADRIVAAPNSEAYGPLSVLIQYYATVSRGFNVPPGAFRPQPKVNSTVIRLDWHPGIADAREFTDFVHHAFSERRKKLSNNLRRIVPGASTEQIRTYLSAAGISVDARPENLSIEEFFRLFQQIRQSGVK